MIEVIFTAVIILSLTGMALILAIGFGKIVEDLGHGEEDLDT